MFLVLLALLLFLVLWLTCFYLLLFFFTCQKRAKLLWGRRFTKTSNRIDDKLKGMNGRGVRKEIEKVGAFIARAGESGIEGNGAEKRNVHLGSHELSAAGGRIEDERALVTVGTDESVHVLNHADDRDAELLAKVDFLADIQKREFLRRS